MFVGSADAVRSQWADVIIANIDAATLESIAPEIERVRKPESTLILSGFPEWDMPEGFSPREILRSGRVALLRLLATRPLSTAKIKAHGALSAVGHFQG